MHQLWTDLRHVTRLVRTAPSFIVLCAVTLGLGIGSAAAMFGIIDRIVLHGPEYIVEPRRVMRFYATVPHPPNELETGSITAYAAYRALRDGTRDLASVAAYQANNWVVGSGADAKSLPGVAASADLFATLGVHPYLGRFYTAREDDPRAPQDVVVLSYEYWIRAFGGDRDILGKTLPITFRPFTVIGIAPPGFTGAEMSPVDYWIPLTAGAHPRPDWPTTWQARWVQVIGRVKAGVSAEQASRDATRAMRLAYSGADTNWRSVSMSLRPLSFTSEGLEPGVTSVARWLTGVTIIVLLIACANIGNLLLTRALRRRGEIAVRLLLGMTRARLAAWLLAEALFVSSLGGIVGVWVAYVAGSAVRRFFLSNIVWSTPVIDPRTLLVTLSLTVGVAVLVSLLPLFQAGRMDFMQAVKTGVRDGGGRQARLRDALLLLETTLTGVLLVVAGLFLKSLMNVRQLDLGIQTDRVIAASVYWPVSSATTSAAAQAAAAQRERATLERVRDSLAHRSDMTAASLVIGSPFRSAFSVDLRVQGWDTLPVLGGGGPYVSAVGQDYFHTVGTRIVRGRGFRPNEGEAAQRTAIVNETMARTLWPKGDALGKCLYVGGLTQCATIVGIANDAHRFGIREEPAMQYYVPLGQEIGMSGVAIVARPRGAIEPAVEQIHRTLAALIPEARYIDVAALQDRVDPQIRPWRLGAAMFGLFAMLALLVAAAGLYSVIAYLVAQRTREFGIRLAVGATASNILSLVLIQGLRIAVAGGITATAISLLLGRLIAPQLFDESPRDPAVYATVILVMTFVAIVALLAPALRASATPPAVALRQE